MQRKADLPNDPLVSEGQDTMLFLRSFPPSGDSQRGVSWLVALVHTKRPLV